MNGIEALFNLELTPEDERILDEVHQEMAAEDAEHLRLIGAFGVSATEIASQLGASALGTDEPDNDR